MKMVYLMLSFGLALPAFAQTQIPDYGRPGLPADGARQRALEKCKKEHPGANCLDIISADNQIVRPADAGRPGLPDGGKRQRLIESCLKTNTQAYCLDLYSVKKDSPAARVQSATLLPSDGGGEASH